MKEIPVRLEQRPHYVHGQLLNEDDFRDEQAYHREARRRHNLQAHDAGVVHGLRVTRTGATTVAIASGYAIDGTGRELELRQTESLDLSGFEPEGLVRVSLCYQEGEPGDDTNRVQCYTLIRASAGGDIGESAVLLATVQLDGEANIGEDAISHAQTRYAAARLADGSVTARKLAPELRRGWLRMPFRPAPLVNLPDEKEEKPPEFRVGPTEALSPTASEKREEDPGAGGTMAFPLPPGVRKITRFRIAGGQNDGRITVRLFLGGWNPKENKHDVSDVLDEVVSGAPYCETYEIPESRGKVDPEYDTLSVWVLGTARTAVSLVAVECEYED